MDAVWDGRSAGSTEEEVDGGKDRPTGMGNLGWIYERPIVHFVAQLCKMRGTIELPFCVMSRVGQGISVLDKVHIRNWEGGFGGV